MGESRLIVDEKTIKYTGLISVKGLYRIAKSVLKENGYDPYEARNEEEVYEDGKQIILWMYGTKKLSNFAKVTFECKFFFTKMHDMDVEKDGRTIKMQKGSVLIETSVFLVTDYNKSFEQNAFQYFMRTMIDKFVFKSYINRGTDAAKKNYAVYEEKLKNFLNMERFR